MGTAQQAGSAGQDDWIPGDEGQRFTVFTIPVPALNAPFECAAYSRNRQLWYDRQLLIDASALPEDALTFALPDYALVEKAVTDFEPDGEAASEAVEAEAAGPTAPEPVALPRPDGEYSIEVNLAGGSGRANVSSPTLLNVREGKAWARLLWSSPDLSRCRKSASSRAGKLPKIIWNGSAKTGANDPVTWSGSRQECYDFRTERTSHRETSLCVINRCVFFTNRP